MSEPDTLTLTKPSADPAPLRTVTLAITSGPFTGDRAAVINSGPEPITFTITYNGKLNLETTIPAGGAIDISDDMEGLS